jgi:hypothetical protein
VDETGKAKRQGPPWAASKTMEDHMSDHIKSSFITQLAAMSVETLTQQALICGELEGEEECHARAANYREQRDLVDAIGRFRFGIKYDEACEKVAAS